MAPHSSTLAWIIPWTEEPGRLQSMGSLGVGHDWATSLSLSCIAEGTGNPLQYSGLENPRDGGAWWAAIYGVSQSWTQLKRLCSSSSSSTSSRIPVINVPPGLRYSVSGAFGGFHVLPIEIVLPWKSRCMCHFEWWFSVDLHFPCGSAGKESVCNAGDPSSIPGAGRSTLEKGWATHSSILGLPLWLSW